MTSGMVTTWLGCARVLLPCPGPYATERPSGHVLQRVKRHSCMSAEEHSNEIALRHCHHHSCECGLRASFLEHTRDQRWGCPLSRLGWGVPSFSELCFASRVYMLLVLEFSRWKRPGVDSFEGLLAHLSSTRLVSLERVDVRVIARGAPHVATDRNKSTLSSLVGVVLVGVGKHA